jgi:hypothetical protein
MGGECRWEVNGSKRRLTSTNCVSTNRLLREVVFHPRHEDGYFASLSGGRLSVRGRKGVGVGVW